MYDNNYKHSKMKLQLYIPPFLNTEWYSIALASTYKNLLPIVLKLLFFILVAEKITHSRTGITYNRSKLRAYPMLELIAETNDEGYCKVKILAEYFVSLTQRSECRPVKSEVAGSNPAGYAFLF